ncbi:MAG TPA: hypothetical protein VFL62_19875 [Bradyrhizobium sp.]|uniref:hypothetical protein n=1 Tax=Bradyrhizobium sp. TaxID=376 RepID=UPI002D803671|nr:hypothetical protein [Bradyrhizobium sp.]HET7888488.1 hypothetical protein [Bradyrhizobium sp.]
MKSAVVLMLSLLLVGPAAAAETAAQFAKGLIAEPGLHPWSIVTLPDETLVVEFSLDPFVAKQRDLRGEFGAIARRLIPAAFDRFPKLKSVQLTGLVTTRDKRGNEREVQAVMTRFTRATSAAIKWDSVKPDEIIDLSDKKTVSPALAAAASR